MLRAEVEQVHEIARQIAKEEVAGVKQQTVPQLAELIRGIVKEEIALAIMELKSPPVAIDGVPDSDGPKADDMEATK